MTDQLLIAGGMGDVLDAAMACFLLFFALVGSVLWILWALGHWPVTRRAWLAFVGCWALVIAATYFLL
jgi:hypothetical protein